MLPDNIGGAGRALQLRRVPELHFTLDLSQEARRADRAALEGNEEGQSAHARSSN